MIFIAAWFHTLDPFAIQFSPTFGLRWYGLAYATGFLLGWLMFRWFARTGRSPLAVPAAGDFLFALVAGVVLGGRLGYALFYERGLFTTFTDSAPYWNLLAINKGGMASHGGMIGVIIATWWFARRHKVSVLHLMDLAALGCTPGLFLGRIANFINGELLGFPVANKTSPPWWSVKFPQEMHEWIEKLRVDKLASLRDVVGDVNILGSDWSKAIEGASRGSESGIHLLESGVNRLITATHSGNTSIINVLAPLLEARHPSQLYQALTDGPLLAGALILIWLKPRRPGVVAAWFLIVYAVLRIATEAFRMPDAGISLIMGLSRGRVLSLVMLLVGVIALGAIAKMKQPTMPGLLRKA